MPYQIKIIRRLPNGSASYRVTNKRTGRVLAKRTSKKKALAQIRIVGSK